MPIDGVILAAGRSARMQRPKPNLAVGKTTFLERAEQTLRAGGCRDVLVIVPPDAPWADETTAARVIVNPDADSEQIASLRLALRALQPDTAGVLVLPVDVPLVSVATVRALLDAFIVEPAPLLLPFHRGVAGHPVLLAASLFPAVLEQEWEEGVRSLIMAHAREMQEVRVDDPGILIDIDTPDEYRRYIEGQ